MYKYVWFLTSYKVHEEPMTSPSGKETVKIIYTPTKKIFYDRELALESIENHISRHAKKLPRKVKPDSLYKLMRINTEMCPNYKEMFKPSGVK